MTQTPLKTLIGRLMSSAKIIVAVKCFALLASVSIMLACSDSSAMELSAEGYRQMGGPAGRAGHVLMRAAAADARAKEQRTHEQEVARQALGALLNLYGR